MESDILFNPDHARKLPAGVTLVDRDGAVLTGPMGHVAPGHVAPGHVAPGPVRLCDHFVGKDGERVAAALTALFRGVLDRTELMVRVGSGLLAGAPVRLSLEALRDGDSTGGQTHAVALRILGARECPATVQANCGSYDRTARLLTLATANAGVAPWFLDLATGAFTDFPEFGTIIGRPVGDPPPDFDQLVARIHPDDLAGALRELEGLALRKTPRARTNFRLRHHAGHWVPTSTVASLWQEGPDAAPLICAVTTDISDRVASEARLSTATEEIRQAHARLTFLTEGATVGLFEARLHPDGQVDFPHTSARFIDLVGAAGVAPEHLAGHIEGLMDPADLARARTALARGARDASAFQLRIRLDHPEQGRLWLKASAGAPTHENGVATWVGAIDDVTVDVKREEDLRHAHKVAEQMRIRNEQQALYDGLTGLANRRQFDELISDRMAQARCGGPGDLTLVRLDLDRFKHVNDTLGHAAGDRVLMRVADVLRDCVRVGDFASRNGGDEFSVLLAPGATEAEAREIVDRVHRKLAEPLIHAGRQCRFGASFGIAHTDDILATGADVHLFADAALHRAKLDGGNRAEVFSPQLHSDIRRDRSLAVDLFDALENHSLLPWFQPQVNAAECTLYGAEVLLRWDHPTDGIIAPGAFMHVAEQLRLVPDIDRIMMDRTCDVLARWRAAGLVVPKISFNVSAGRMHDPGILAAAQHLADLDTRVTFELLESILVEEENQAFRDNLDTIRAAGVDIEIDDFGSGHASIIGLMQIEPSALKIDQRIVFPVVRDPRARDLVRAIVEIARALGIGTVAEGVESADHAAILRDLGCDVFQGYHYAKPLSEADFLAYARGLGAAPG